MADLNLDLDYFDHPKVVKLRKLLKDDGADVYPIRLWVYCGKFHSKDGRLQRYSASDVERVLRWNGKRGRLVKAMLATRMLIQNKRGFTVHDFRSRNGHISAISMRNRAAANARWDKIRNNNDLQQNTKNASASFGNAEKYQTNALSVPSVQIKDKIVEKPTDEQQKPELRKLMYDFPKKKLLKD